MLLWAADSGARVARQRLALDFSRPRLADVVGTTEATIHRIEHGKINPRDPMRLMIAAAMRCEVADLWPPIPIAALLAGLGSGA